MISQCFKRENHAANLILFLLSAWIVVNPLPHTTTVQVLCFYGSVVLYIVMRYARVGDLHPLKNPLILPVFLFCSWIVICLFFSVDKYNSIHDIYSHFLKYIVLCIMFVSVFDSEDKIRILSFVVIFSLVVFALYSLVTFYSVTGYDINLKFFGNHHGMTYNLISIPLIFAAFLIVCNIASTHNLYFKLLFLLLLVPLVFASISTQARSAFLALAISSFVFLFFHKRVLLPIITVILLGILLCTPLKDRFKQDVSTNIRLNHALLVLEVVKDYPLTGIGFGMETFGYSLDLDSYKKRFEKTYQVQYGQEKVLVDPHNMYTDILVRTGIPGLILYLFFVFSLFRMLWKIRASEDVFLRLWSLGIASSLVAYFVIGFFEPVFNQVQEFYFVVMVSVASMLWRQHCREIKEFEPANTSCPVQSPSP